MKKTVLSNDQTQISYEVSGNGETALLFVHGWLGNKRWWDSQRDFFSDKYLIVQMDLAGHGDSGRMRTKWTAENYAKDIVAVADDLSVKDIILVGHSMSGVYATEAAVKIPNVKALILVDTLKDLDQMITLEQAGQLFDLYRKDFKATVENVLPQYLFAKDTPPEVKTQLQNEFLTNSPDFAIKCIEPLYQTDARDFAKKLNIPVRAINSDVGVTNKQINRKYFADFNYSVIEGVGHYPMLEKPEEFNIALENYLRELIN
ncbi:alpha/beta hydrolase [Bacteriovorax sp. PP10]|uniref:Alpha/beta hydrolase n=1 Tax=Bacteriovorax antarcticus TaxID=3088717 RepID=A0ABU5VWZ9_9BACT|nr:alpha/beta hydrolase [Bacteriovorax sp. PP10]MEA9357589.1 alpha/beta hydrolase [Bacteriovorax sp. PP10]